MPEPMTRAFVQAIEQFPKDEQIPMVSFEKGQRKDAVAADFRAKFPRSFLEGKASCSSAKLKRKARSIALRSGTTRGRIPAMPGL